jgi:hypothetical protein
MKRALKHIILMAFATLLLLATGNAYAQIVPDNTGDDPYLGTTHRYVVTVDDWDNDQIWTLEHQSGSPEYTPTTSPGNTFISTEIVGNLYYIDITFTRDDFDVGTWILRYEEENTTDGCIATRDFLIHLQENTFYEALYDESSETPPATYSECHDSTGTVQNWDLIKNINVPTRIYFPVYMYKDEDFKLNSWQFEATFSLGNTEYELVSINKGATNSLEGASYTITNVDADTWRIEVLATSDTSYTADNIELEVEVTGEMYYECAVTMTLTNGKALSGTNDRVETEDNVYIYPDVAGTTESEWRTRKITINALPATTNITITN